MSNFVPCPACNRHVLCSETACPFCSAALPESRCEQSSAPRSPGRLSRAAMLAAGAALMGAEACSNSVTPVYGGPPGGAGGSSMTSDGGGGAGGSPSDGSAVALYGAAPAALEQTPPDEGASPPAGNKK